ncbi:MAG: hypothetical protein A2020_15060 [Lentisphaerae bacterium GWF2_45_14]|nr:MAG: hypothetical protein A2020_15060 [Lentisphaerae bacterium GWF2_45_14]
MSKFLYSRDLDFSSRGDIARIQGDFLKKHLSFCKMNSPYYKNLLNGIDLSGDIFEVLKKIPLTDKDVLTRHKGEFVAVAQDDIQDIVFSSGTTGEPLSIVYTATDLERLAYNELRTFLACGMRKSDRVLLTCTLDRCFIAGLAYFEGARAIGAATIRNGLNSMESHLEIIRRLKPTVLVGVPSFLKRLIEYLDSENTIPEHVRMLLCIGEPVRGLDLELNPLGHFLEKHWGAKVYSTYASSETITSFCDCESACGGHLLPELAVLEILDENAREVPCGEIGEVVVTPLQIEGMPLIRFRTGDISFKVDEPCSCGRNSLRLGPIIGRKQQMMKINGTTLYPQTVFTALEGIEGITDYYITAKRLEYGLSDYAEVHVALTNDLPDKESIVRKLAALTRVKLPVIIEPAEKVRAKIFSINSRKPVRFFDDTQSQQSEVL